MVAVILSHRQRDVFSKVPDDWGDLPGGIGCTNRTLESLERRGLVETRIEPSKRLTFCGGWQWRKTPNAELRGAEPIGGASRSNDVLGADAPERNEMEWQPIETAPKDGEYVLVSNGRGVWVARFKDVYQSGWKPACPWQSMMLNHDHIPSVKRKGNPTHWMPLPEAPNGQGNGQAARRG